MQWLVPLRCRLVRRVLLIALYRPYLPLAAAHAEGQLDLSAHFSKDPSPRTPLQRWLAGTQVLASAPGYDSSVPPSTYSGSGGPPVQPGFFRMLRRSRDGGVRLAGGSPSDVEANALPPGEYDQLEAMTEGSTLPPAYQPHRAT